MKRWEYKVIDTNDVPRRDLFKGKNREDVEAFLNKLGDQGWEIVCLDAVEFHGSYLSLLGIAKRER
jgi:hypothetical protein